uniref:Uncharacterized protein n=1 Tax=Panagrolaimus sp. PS1159 TaxID=55785 RepID=A0AC35FEZ2_9BILA
MSNPQYFIGINNSFIGIYDSNASKLLSPIKISPLTYKKSSKIYIERVKNGLTTPASQQNISLYTRQVFNEIFLRLKIKQKQIASIVFVFNDTDIPLNRIWITRFAAENGIKNINMIGWKTALCMELLVKSKFKAADGECAVMIVLFEDFYHLICVKKINFQWIPQYYKVFANDFSPQGFQKIKSHLSTYNFRTIIVYHFTDKFYKMKVNHIFRDGLSPANVKFYKRKEDYSKDCLNGAVFKARAIGKDAIAMDYEVIEIFWLNLRMNCDNNIFIELDTYMKPLPFTVTREIDSDVKIKQFSIQYNCNNQDKEWKTTQIYPYSLNLFEFSVSINFDINGVISFVIEPPHPDDNKIGQIFARFIRPKIEKPNIEMPEPSKYFPSKEVKVVGRLRGRKTLHQKQTYRPKRARRSRQSVFFEESPKKTKVKKNRESIEERKELRAVARRMRKWQEKKFLFE